MTAQPVEARAPFLTLEMRDHIATVTLARPERRNALDAAAYGELEAVFGRIAAEPQVRCVVLTGADPAFCAGEDVKALMGRDEAQAEAERLTVLHHPAATPIVRYPATPPALAVLECDRPVIVAVNGAAIGWGMELALYGDVRLASERAVFSHVFIKRGLVPDVGGFLRLPEIVGPAKAAELIFTGDAINAAEALRIGLVSEVTPHEELLPRAHALAARIAANPPLALRYAKEGLRLARHGDPRAIGGWCNAVIDRLRQTEDHREGVASFLEKRPPAFVGR